MVWHVGYVYFSPDTFKCTDKFQIKNLVFSKHKYYNTCMILKATRYQRNKRKRDLNISNGLGFNNKMDNIIQKNDT